MMRIRLALTGLLAALLALTACSNAASNGSGHPSVDTTQSTSQSSKPQPKTIWQKTLSQFRPDGTVSTRTALTAFAEAIGPVPGVTVPAGPTGTIQSGTLAVRWVFAHWAQLTNAQRVAIKTDLGTPPVHHFTGDAGDTDIDPNIPCQTQDGAGTTPYRDEFDSIVNLLTPHLWPLRIGDHIFFVDNTKSINPKDPADDGKNTLGYVVGCTGKDATPGTPKGCTIHVNPGRVASTIHDLLIHEMTHCFMMQRWGANNYFSMPDWFVEGGAEWAQTSVGTGDQVATAWWHQYLSRSGVPLDQFTYDGIGFFVHLAESRADPWKLMEPMGDAMAGKPNATAAGWAAAKPNQQFLNSWGSGFAQGHYPGEDWQTTGPHLDHYPSPIVDLNKLVNNDVLPIGSVPFAANLSKPQISADIVQVARHGSDDNGLLSLGGSRQTTLADTAGVNYCTLTADKCHCPKDSSMASAQFTHMEPGTEWIGLTGGPDAAHIELHGQSLDDFCKNVSKLVGTWKSTQATGLVDYTGHNETQTGGAGVIMTINRKGNITANYDGMTRMDIVKHLPYKPMTGYSFWRGTQNAVTLLPDRKTTAGKWDPTPGSNTVTVGGELVKPTVIPYGGTLDDNLAQGTNGRTGFVGPINPGTWTINGNTLRLTVDFTRNQHFTGTWTFTRVGKH